MPFDVLNAQMRDADVVVTHAGVGSVLCARQAGHVPVVVPRLHRLDEHVDDHQVELVAALGADGHVIARHGHGAISHPRFRRPAAVPIPPLPPSPCTRPSAARSSPHDRDSPPVPAARQPPRPRGHGAAAHASRPRARRPRPRGHDRLRRGPHRRLRPPARRRPRHRAVGQLARRPHGGDPEARPHRAQLRPRALHGVGREPLGPDGRRPRAPPVGRHGAHARPRHPGVGGRVVARQGDRAAPQAAGPVDLRDRARRRRPGGGAARGGRPAGQARPHPQRRAARPHPRGRRLRADARGHRRPGGREGRHARRALLRR